MSISALFMMIVAALISIFGKNKPDEVIEYDELLLDENHKFDKKRKLNIWQV